jgi:hypothetical protein
MLVATLLLLLRTTVLVRTVPARGISTASRDQPLTAHHLRLQHPDTLLIWRGER